MGLFADMIRKENAGNHKLTLDESKRNPNVAAPSVTRARQNAMYNNPQRKAAHQENMSSVNSGGLNMTARRTSSQILDEATTVKNTVDQLRMGDNYKSLLQTDPIAAGSLFRGNSWKNRKEINENEARYNNLMTEYYYADNSEKWNSIQNSDLHQVYDTGRQTQSDAKKLSNMFFTSIAPDVGNAEFQNFLQTAKQNDMDYLSGKYGTDNYFELNKKIDGKIGEVSRELSNFGYNFDRISDYENRIDGIVKRYEQMEANQKLADENAFWASASTIPVAALQGLDYVNKSIQTVQQRKRGANDWRPIDSTDMELTNYVTDIRGRVGDNIEANTDLVLFDENVARFLYETGMSAADSSVGVILGGSAGASALLASEAAANTAKTALDSGATGRQATMSGLAAGCAELIAEKLGIDYLLKPRPVESLKDTMREILKQSVVGLSEEALTEAVNMISFAVITKQNKEFHEVLKKEFEGGASVFVAYLRALTNALGRVGWAGAAGAITGGLKGAVDNTGKYKNHTQYIQNIYGVDPDALINESLALNPQNKFAKYLQSLRKQGKNISGSALNALIHQNEKIIQKLK